VDLTSTSNFIQLTMKSQQKKIIKKSGLDGEKKKKADEKRIVS